METHYGICSYMALLVQCILSDLSVSAFLFSIRKTSKQLYNDILLPSFTFHQNKINNFSLLCLSYNSVAVI